MAALGMEGSYVAIRARVDDLGSAVEDLREGRLHGMNLTMPLKTAVVPMTDRLTPEAERARSVNTLRLADGLVEGHSSDVTAARSALADPRFPASAPVLVLGSGGAAAAILVAAAGRKVFVAARSPHRIGELVSRTGADAVLTRFGDAVEGALVVNATPIGMGDEELPSGLLESASGVVDLPYGSGDTPAVRTAVELGLPFLDGVEFLAMQAAESFRFWTGVEPPLDVMMEAAKKA